MPVTLHRGVDRDTLDPGRVTRRLRAPLADPAVSLSPSRFHRGSNCPLEGMRNAQLLHNIFERSRIAPIDQLEVLFQKSMVKQELLSRVKRI